MTIPFLSKLLPDNASIKIRISVFVVFIVVVASLVTATIAQYVLKQGMKETIGKGQFTSLSNIANSIDQKFEHRKILLKLFAEGIPLEAIRHPSELQDYLARYAALSDIFDSTSILDRFGNVIANFNGMSKIGKVNTSDRPYFIDTMRTKQGVISKPLLNRVSQKPQVIMTQPVLDESGNVIYVISAGIDLQEPKFLGGFADLKFSKTGYLFILNTDGIVVDHPHKDLILKVDGVDGSRNISSEMALAGFEGSTEALNRDGISGLYTYKRIKSTNWILGSIYPTSEAFASINEMLLKALLSSFTLSVVAGILVWWFTRSQLAPLQVLSDHMRTAYTQNVYVPLQTQFKGDEIGELGIAFNKMMQEKEAALLRIEESEQYLRSILAHAGDAFVSCDVDGKIREWNEKAVTVFGWTEEEAVGVELSTLIIPQPLRRAHVRRMKKFVETGKGAMVDRRMIVNVARKDGVQIPVELMVTAVHSASGYTANAFIRDISDRLLTEQKLAKSEKRLRMVTDSLPALISYVDRDGKYQFANAFYKTLLGFEYQNMIGRTVQELFGEQNYKAMSEGVQRTLKGEHVHFERDQTLNGKLSHLSVDYIPDTAVDGTVMGLYVMALDITDRKMAELRQAESEERLRTIADNLPAQIAFIDSQERYLFVNAALAAVAEYSPDAMIGKTMKEVRDPDLYQFLAPFVEQVLNGHSVTFQGEGYWEGNLRHYESVYIPARTKAGDISGFYAMTFDTTERKRLEIIKNEFISTVSHELRTPLTSINGALGLIIAGVVGEVPEKVKDLMVVARRNVERLIRMINDMLDIEKIESGRMIFDIQPHNLANVLKLALDSSQAYASQYGVNINLYADTKDANAYIDQDRFIQVIVNLLSNAIKFSSEGGEVKVNLYEELSSWRIDVCDEGLGIPGEFHHIIFKKFSQVDGTNSRKKGGSGLGLSICKPIVEQMGGSIDFSSVEGKGSIFFIMLPKLMTKPM